MKNLASLAISIIAIVGVGFLFIQGPGHAQQDAAQLAGSITGPDVYTDMIFHGRVTYNGALSTTTTASMTLTLNDLAKYETVIDLPGTTVGSAVTITLPASSTLGSFLPKAGDTARQCWINATSTTNTNIIFAGGTGTNLLVASSSATALGGKMLLNGKQGCFLFTRIGAGANARDINAVLTVFQ